MKHLKMLLLLSFFAAVTVSCKNGPVQPQNSTTVITPPVTNISLKLNGVSRSSAVPQALYSKTAGRLQITASFNSGESITLEVKNPAAGTFSVNNGDASAAYSLDNSFSNVYVGSTGTITISAFTSTTVSGVFQFSGLNTKSENGNITDGLFVANLIVQ